MTRSIRRLQWRGLIIVALLIMPGGPPSAWAQNTFPASGNVGIGTTTPFDRLTAVGGALPLSGTGFQNSGAVQDLTNYRGVLLGYDTSGQIGVVAGSTAVSPSSLAFWTYSGNGWNEWIRITGGGNVGIGTTAPGAKLHVAGDVQVDGNLAARYQDVAEWVQAPIPVSPGNVVVIDPQGHNQVLPASQPYDTRVAGVVSARPGLLLGEAGESKVKVAHSGRVKVKVDTSYGPIAVGDLLVTSPTLGHAMRSTPLELGGTRVHRPGTLLGKALESLETGQGEILVLLTLQ